MATGLMKTPKATVVPENADRWRHADCYACGCPIAGAANASTNAWAVQIASDLVELGPDRYGPPRYRANVDPVHHARPVRRSAGPFPGIEGGLWTRRDFSATCPECRAEQVVIVAEMRGSPNTPDENALIADDPAAYDRGQKMFGANIALALRRLTDSRKRP